MSDQSATLPNEIKSTFTVIPTAKAEDTQRLVTNASDDPDDTFAGMYTVQDAKGHVSIIEPTFKPATLLNITLTNNILSQCVQAMEVNIDGTGHTIESVLPEEQGEDASDSPEKQMLVDFFDEPYPERSMIDIRRHFRHDLEGTGNGYLEVIRNAADELVMLNHLPSVDMRLVRLDDPVWVSKILVRRGREVSVKVRVRERRFVQIVNGVKTYFKEFGASRDLDRNTGKWAEKGQRLPIQKRASEVIHLRVLVDAKSPYGLPRWINQLPSVLGSRKAEEYNLDFFDAGGLPPVLVLVQGGYLSEGVKDSLTAHLASKGANKHRAAVVEAIAASGSLDSAGTVKVTVERFGTERQQDSMFQAYDKNAEEHVRVAFRLPPLFIGRAQDYNFATAQTGYMVAEAQVFAPERLIFDEAMWWVCKDMGAKEFTFKSKPLTLTDAANQLKALELANTGNFAEKEGIVHALNTLTGLNLSYTEPPDPMAQPGVGPGAVNQVPEEEAFKGDTALHDLATRWAEVLGLVGTPPNDDEAMLIMAQVNALKGEQLRLFTETLATLSLNPAYNGLAELCGSVR